MGSNFGIGWTSWKNSFVETKEDYDVRLAQDQSTTRYLAPLEVFGAMKAASSNLSLEITFDPFQSTPSGCDRNCSFGTICTESENGYKCATQCEMYPGYCLNNGICSTKDNGKIACWCPSSSKWWYRGERCEVAESIAKVAVIAGSISALALFAILFLVIRMAKMSERARQDVGHTLHRNRAFRVPNRLRQHRTNLPGVALSVSNPFEPTLESQSESPRRVTSFVRYSQIGTITKEGEARTNFTSSNLPDLAAAQRYSVGGSDMAHLSFPANVPDEELAVLKAGSRYQTAGKIL